MRQVQVETNPQADLNEELLVLKQGDEKTKKGGNDFKNEIAVDDEDCGKKSGVFQQSTTSYTLDEVEAEVPDKMISSR